MNSNLRLYNSTVFRKLVCSKYPIAKIKMVGLKHVWVFSQVSSLNAFTSNFVFVYLSILFNRAVTFKNPLQKASVIKKINLLDQTKDEANTFSLKFSGSQLYNVVQLITNSLLPQVITSEKKCFITLKPGVYIYKIFNAPLYNSKFRKLFPIVNNFSPIDLNFLMWFRNSSLSQNYFFLQFYKLI